jgi:hypothetical protein
MAKDGQSIWRKNKYKYSLKNHNILSNKYPTLEKEEKNMGPMN